MSKPVSIYFSTLVSLSILSLAKCQSNMCFRMYPSCTMVGGQPFFRDTAASINQCQQRCLISRTEPRFCRSLIYVAEFGICDLYNMKVGNHMSRLIHFEGRQYFEPTGLCSPDTRLPVEAVVKSIEIDPPPRGSVCEPRTVPKLSRLEGIEQDGGDDYIVDDVSEEECVKICIENQGPDGSLVWCRSVDYRRDTGSCLISKTAIQPDGSGKPAARQRSSYYVKFCVPEDQSAETCPSTVMRIPSKALVGIADDVISVNTVEECMQSCYGRVLRDGYCKAGVFFNEFGECILSEKDSRSHPELYTDALPQEVTQYFEVDCEPKPSIFRIFGMMTPRPNIRKSDETDKETMLRKVKDELDLLSSEMPNERFCKVDDCCPFLDSCEVGIRTFSNGNIQWCKEPCAVSKKNIPFET